MKTGRAAGENGFVLLGVVMFVIVLTILGLSLFGLSGYEGQFLNASLERSNVFQTANGGLDRSRWALAVSGQLQSVKNNLPMGDLRYAVAWQSGRDDSTGPVDFSPNAPNVTIRVIVDDQSGQEGRWRCLEAQFKPSQLNLYDRLMSLSGVTAPGGAKPGLYVPVSGGVPSTPRRNQVVLVGELRQNYDVVPNWQQQIGSLGPGSDLTVTFGGMPDPDVPTYLAAKHPVALRAWQVPYTQGASHNFDFNAAFRDHPSDSVAFYETRWDDPDHGTQNGPSDSPAWAINIKSTQSAVNVTVKGVAIWLVDGGFLCQQPITVYGTASDMLVIVASEQRQFVAGEPGAGIAFIEGVISPTVPVILVSDGRVGIENTNTAPNPANVRWLNIFASNAIITGPESGTLALRHPVDDAAKKNLEKLTKLAALPNTLGTNNKFAFQPGTWRDLKPSDLN